MTVERRLRGFRAPDEEQAADRAWDVIRAVELDSEPRRPRALGRRIALAPALVVIVALVSLSPAGAQVGRWIDQALGVKRASPALFSLPAPGSVLVSAADGTWTVGADGAKRNLGSWSSASWSPHGTFVAVASGDQLAAVDPHGRVRWALSRAAVADPRWYAPTGYRIAYLSGTTLRVVVGDGTGDRALAGHVARVAPAWRGGSPYELAYMTAGGRLVVRDADTGRVAWTQRITGHVRLLEWTSDGSRLIVLTDHAAEIRDAGGRLVARTDLSLYGPIDSGALSPDGKSLALVRESVGEVSLLDLTHGGPPRRVFAGDGVDQVVFSPDGRWLLVSWPAADQWIFVRIGGAPRVVAASRIAEQFAPGSRARGFPQLDGWCCAR
jgi:hypothetical protein